MTAHERSALGLAGVLWAHLPRDGYDDERDQETTYCTCGGWAGNYFAEGEAGPFDVHLVQVLLAHLADVLGSDETKMRLANTLNANGASPGDSIHGWRCEHPDRYGPCTCLDEVTDDLVTAVCEVLGLPGGGA